MLLVVLRSLVWIWPFISEMFFGGKSIKVVAKENIFLVLILVLLAVSVFFNYVSFSKIYQYTLNKTKSAESHTAGKPTKATTPQPPASTPSVPEVDVEITKEKLRNIFHFVGDEQ